MALYVLIAVIVIAAVTVGCTFTGTSEEPVSSHGPVSSQQSGTVESDSIEENSHDASVQETDLPPYAENWSDCITAPEGGSLGNFPVYRYDGNGWYIYLPVSAWNKVQVDELFADDQWRWESEYQTGSSLTIDHFASPMEVLWADAQKQGYTPLDSEKYIWNKSDNGVSGRYYFSEAADGGCFRVSIQWTDANITDNPYIAMEPDVLRLVAESFTVETE